MREALTLVRVGARWKSGKDIKIWKEPWLLHARDPDPFIQSPIAASLEEADVSSLRMPDEPGWDDILNDLFNDRDKGLIKSVPLSARDERDRWMGAPG